MANNPNSVLVSVETTAESEIREISYDGEEIYTPPFTMSEHLTRLAQKIDFTKNYDDMEAEIIESEKAADAPPEIAAIPINPPWEAIANKIRNAATEICVLVDVLNIAKEKHYMILDPVPQSQDGHDFKAIAHIYSRKKGLAQAASMLTSAAERLRCVVNEVNRNNRGNTDFHSELLILRQNWRLKKVANSIVGDLSFRSGSKFQQSGIFEVMKADDDNATSFNASPPLSPLSAPIPPKNMSSVRVEIPKELQGAAYIKVMMQKDQENLFSTAFKRSETELNVNPDLHWQLKLEAAQNVLFCREIYNQVAREAIQLQADIPHVVIGNQINATVFPGIQLIISLCHKMPDEKPVASAANGDANNAPPPVKAKHDHVLEHSLHQLLREVHHRNTHQPYPHPSSGLMGPSKKRYLAGSNAADRYDLMMLTKSPTLLEQVVEQAQHFIMRQRTENVLDTITKQIKDPVIISHWNFSNSPTQTCVNVAIVSHGYDQLCRTSLLIEVLVKTLNVYCADGRVMHLSYELQELRDLISCQICQHQITGVQSLAKAMGWQILSGIPHLGLGSVEPLGNASACMIASPLGDRIISVKCQPEGGVRVSVSQSPRKDFFSGQIVRDRKWENLGGPFREVKWDKMEGRNFMNKMELLMASLTSSA